ncbi:MAG: hypothetical protein GKR99_12555 [Rhodobacteraceae bacterium]|nr:hypothetical protein [Paracoccaceae bacterium]
MRRILLLTILSLTLPGCAGTNIFGQITGQKIETAPVAEVVTPEEALALELKDIRARMVARADVSDADLVKLAGSGDGLAAYNYAGRLSGRGDEAALRYFVQAANDGLDYAYLPITKFLRRDDVTFSEQTLAIARNALNTRAQSDTQMALIMAEFYEGGQPFGQDPAESRRYLTIAANNQNAGAALKLATHFLLDGEDREQGFPAARKYLGIAVASDDLAARVTAENLLRSLGPAPATLAQTTPKIEEEEQA